MSRVEEFNVNDVVVGHSFQLNKELDGARGVILEPLQYGKVNFNDGSCATDYFYRVKWNNGHAMWISPRNLRKPPEEFDHATKLAYAELVQRLTRVHAFEKAAKP